MKWILGLVAGFALGAGLMLLVRTGDTLWASDVQRTHTPMIFLFLLFVLFPLIGLIMAPRRRK